MEIYAKMIEVWYLWLPGAVSNQLLAIEEHPAAFASFIVIAARLLWLNHHITKVLRRNENND